MKKILIVDDEKINLYMTENILSTQYKTFTANSGQEAIGIFENERPDLILTDLRMPEMSGFELQSTLQNRYDETIPVMFMTADNTDETESRSFESGAVDYITKPFRADVLLRRVENILKNVDLKRASETDPMTGLLNKMSSQQEIDRAVKSGSGALLMIDLDSFKLVNDLYGHAMGDRILIRFAEIIRTQIRQSDIAGRLGGDEFVAFCRDVRDEAVIARKAKYINEEILKSAKEYMGEDMTIPLGASIGAVLSPNEGTDFHTLYEKADQALYEIKEHGKHGYALFSGKKDGSAETGGDLSDIDTMIQVLSERNRKKGAFGQPFEKFRFLYQYLARMESNYHHENRLILYTLKSRGENADKIIGADEREELTNRCFEEVRSDLRASDVVSVSPGGQIVVLLLEANEHYANMVAERVMARWDKTDDAKEWGLSYEMDVIR